MDSGISALTLANCVTFGKSPDFSEPQLTASHNGNRLFRVVMCLNKLADIKGLL